MKWLGFTAGLFGIDFLMKEGVEAQKPENFPHDMDGTKGKIRLYRNHNKGFCFGFLQENQTIVKQLPLVFTSACAGAFIWLLSRKEGRLSERLSLSLITAGALSNLYDRLKRGYVVDYFSIRIRGLEKVVFNLGDIFIFAGSIVLVLSDLAGGIRNHSPRGVRRWPWKKQH